ncbi:MAG TPA: hypothetical protein VD978_33975 [Azospirillum sp.]|nr:hypothetical protein [Azospirillum sp.]
MLFHPATMALNLASLANVAALVLAATFGVRILRHWNIASGSEGQLRLERQTYLVSTLLGIVLAAELVSLFLFVYTADRLSVMFVGAMCAVGTLNASVYGFPALGLKIACFFAAAVWLLMNAVDNRGWDYPMIRAKYGVLLLLLPLFAAAAAVQVAFFADLKGDVLVSCCSKLFTAGGSGVSAGMATLPPMETLTALGIVLAVVATMAWPARRSPRWALAYAAVCAVLFAVAIAAVVSAVSPYIYEHPHHHCPFCLLKAEYGYIGYALYLPLFGGVALGLGVAPIQAFRTRESLALVVPAASRGLVGASVALLLVFALVVTATIALSGLRLT